MQRADFEPFAWWLARERIGTDLREYYAATQELPSQIFALVERLDDAVEGDPVPPRIITLCAFASQ